MTDRTTPLPDWSAAARAFEAAIRSAPMTPVPDYIAGARALLAASSDCTIDGEPAVVVRVAELNDLVARVHEAEAVARITPDNPPTRSVGTFAEHGPGWDPITGDRTWDEVKDHQFTGLAIDTPVAGLAANATTRHVGTCSGYETEPNRCTCGCEGCTHNCSAHQEAAVAAPATADDGLRATPAEAAVNRVRSWIAGEPVTARSGFGDGYREALRDVLDVIDRKGADHA